MDRILVTGASGQQGGAVLRHLRADDLTVRVMLRDIDSDKAKALSDQGCELVRADFDQPDSLSKALDGVNAAFLAFPLSDKQTEIARGQAFIEAAVQARLPYLLFSAALDANHPTGVDHFDSKHLLVGQLSSSGLHHNVLGPGGFMENLLFPQTWNGLAKGKLTTPFAIDVPQALVAVDDIGRYAAIHLAQPPAQSGQFIPLYAECLSSRQQAAVIGEVFGRQTRATKLPWLLTRLFLGRQLTGMFDYFNCGQAPSPPANQAFAEALDPPTSFRDWLGQQTPPA